MYQLTSFSKYGRFAVAAIALFFLFLTGCRKNLKWLEVDPAYAQYVESYTTGSISKTSSVRVRLSQDAKTTHSIGEPVKENLFEFTPEVKGKAIWLDARTIEFKPDNMLKPDELYNVDFKLGKVTNVPSKFEHMKFSLHTLTPAFKVTENGLRSSGSKETMFLNGNLETSDFEEPAAVEKILSAKAADKDLKLVWQHSNNNKTHSFTINNIPRGLNENSLHLKWDGAPLNITNKNERTISVPSQSEFKVLDVRAVNETQQYASVLFSNPIAIGQDLNGFIS